MRAALIHRFDIARTDEFAIVILRLDIRHDSHERFISAFVFHRVAVNVDDFRLSRFRIAERIFRVFAKNVFRRKRAVFRDIIFGSDQHAERNGSVCFFVAYAFHQRVIIGNGHQ